MTTLDDILANPKAFDLQSMQVAALIDIAKSLRKLADQGEIQLAIAKAAMEDVGSGESPPITLCACCMHGKHEGVCGQPNFWNLGQGEPCACSTFVAWGSPPAAPQEPIQCKECGCFSTSASCQNRACANWGLSK